MSLYVQATKVSLPSTGKRYRQLEIISTHADGGPLSLCLQTFEAVAWPPINMSGSLKLLCLPP